MRYNLGVVEILETEEFRRWLEGLRDRRTRARILLRLRRMSLGDLGDARAIGEGVFELRIDDGPGYRVYCTRCGEARVAVLLGGVKKRQRRDIAKAKALARDV